jgi:hypothetical protein
MYIMHAASWALLVLMPLLLVNGQMPPVLQTLSLNVLYMHARAVTCMPGQPAVVAQEHLPRRDPQLVSVFVWQTEKT